MAQKCIQEAIATHALLKSAQLYLHCQQLQNYKVVEFLGLAAYLSI